MGLSIMLMHVPDDFHQAKSVKSPFNLVSRPNGQDKEFCYFVDSLPCVVRSCHSSYCCSDVYVRPLNFEEVKTWVKENMPWEEEEPCLTDVIELMEKDTNLYFYFGW